MQSNAQDTATSLGLSLTENMGDKATMLSMVKAIFDRGNFEKIRVLDNEGNKIIERRLNNGSYSVPKWFVDWIDLPIVERRAVIMKGWIQAGEVVVESFPDIAYRNLWRIIKHLFYWYLALTILCLFFGFIAIRFLLRPLRAVVRQAQAISNQDYIIEENIPKTHELKQVTEAINKMVLKVKEVFSVQVKLIDKLNKDAFQDGLLKIGNRRFFMQNLSNFLSSEENYRAGYIILTEISDLHIYNKKHGFKEGDRLISEVNQAIVNALDPKRLSLHARISGSTFACLLIDNEQGLREQLENLHGRTLKIVSENDPHLRIITGAASYQFKMSSGQAMATADNALQHALADGINTYHIISHAAIYHTKPASDWLPIMNEAIDEKRVLLFSQNVINKHNDIYHREIYIKLKTKNSEILSAGMFLPIVEKLAFGFNLDKYVLTELFQYLTPNDPPVAINLSSSSVSDLDNQEQIIELVKGIPPKFRHNLQIEISETIILSALQSSKMLIDELRVLGCKIGIDRVGANFSALLHHLNQLKVNYLKICGSYSQDLESDPEKKTFLHHVQLAASTLSIDVIATSVESESQWHTLLETDIQLGQGLYLADISQVL